VPRGEGQKVQIDTGGRDPGRPEVGLEEGRGLGADTDPDRGEEKSFLRHQVRRDHPSLRR
jgi:hypothetical protein